MGGGVGMNAKQAVRRYGNAGGSDRVGTIDAIPRLGPGARTACARKGHGKFGSNHFSSFGLSLTRRPIDRQESAIPPRTVRVTKSWRCPRLPQPSELHDNEYFVVVRKQHTTTGENDELRGETQRDLMIVDLLQIRVKFASRMTTSSCHVKSDSVCLVFVTSKAQIACVFSPLLQHTPSLATIFARSPIPPSTNIPLLC